MAVPKKEKRKKVGPCGTSKTEEKRFRCMILYRESPRVQNLPSKFQILSGGTPTPPPPLNLALRPHCSAEAASGPGTALYAGHQYMHSCWVCIPCTIPHWAGLFGDDCGKLETGERCAFVLDCNPQRHPPAVIITYEHVALFLSSLSGSPRRRKGWRTTSMSGVHAAMF